MLRVVAELEETTAELDERTVLVVLVESGLAEDVLEMDIVVGTLRVVEELETMPVTAELDDGSGLVTPRVELVLAMLDVIALLVIDVVVVVGEVDAPGEVKVVEAVVVIVPDTAELDTGGESTLSPRSR